MKLSYNWLKELVPIKLSPDKLAELLTFHVAEIEKVEKVGRDTLLYMDVLPNRAHDLHSHVGVAREIAALTNTKCRISNIKFGEDKKKKTADVLSVRIEDAQGCPRYIGRYVEGVRIGPSPKWLRERLGTLGMRSINSVVDATNFVMLEYGQPLHVFDADEVAATNLAKHKPRKTQTHKEVVIRRAKKGEKFTTLDDQTFALDGGELLIADSQKTLALAGIKGGKKAGVGAKTKNLILEAANFDSALIRRTSKKLGITTDASKLFSGGLHPVLAERAMDRVVSLIGELAGGVVYKNAVDIFPRKWPQARIVFNVSACNTLLGVSRKETEIRKILRALGCVIDTKKHSSGRSGAFLVTAPAQRLDLVIPEDLYEEIGRMHGWERISASPPHGHLAAGKEEPMFRLAELARTQLAGMGYAEHVGHTFMEAAAEPFFRKAGYALCETANPLGSDTRYLRPTLMPSLLQAVSANTKRKEAIRMFEIGKTFGRGERWSLGIALWLAREGIKREAWYDAKGMLEALFSSLGLAGTVFGDMPQKQKEYSRALFESATLCSIFSDGTPLGNMGEISARMKGAYDIAGTVVCAHIDLASLLAHAQREREFAEIPKFPGIARDIAVLVQKGTKVETVQNVIEREGGELLWDTDLFDAYEGAAVGAGRESLAFRLLFQSTERTLRDVEVRALMERVSGALKAEGWEIRE